MKDADDTAIMRQLMLAVAASIFCLLCGGISGVIIVRNDYDSGAGGQQVQLPPAPPGA
jgi:hypothetical protein